MTWQQVEAALFASGRYLSVEDIAELATVTPREVEEAIDTITKKYAEMNSGLTIFEENEMYKMNVKSDYTFVVRRVVNEAELPKNLLQSLALISYKAPVLQSEIVDARGARVYDHIHTLVDKGFVKREPEGRTYILHVTDKFYDYFEVENPEDVQKAFEGRDNPEINIDLPTEEELQEDNENAFEDFLLSRMKKLDDADDPSQDTEFLSYFDEELGKVKDRVDKAAPDEKPEDAEEATSEE